MKFIYSSLFIAFLFGCKNQDSKKEYSEKYRPQLHFTPKAKWMNDPNGMVYYDGEYHLFYQHFPDSTVWGPMHWGHAVSKNLIEWEHLPIAIYPDSLGWIFSGSAVIDWKNTTNLGKDGKPPMIAIYTYHNDKLEKEGRNNFQYQGLAYSLDKGRTWIKYAKNPVLPNPGIRDFRDPKVSWSEQFQKWFMILAVVDHTNIYSSENLLTWKLESEFGYKIGAHGGVWECPDLFPLKLEGTDITKWVMLVSINPGAPNGGSGTQYFIGDFNGKTFKTQQEVAKWIDYGKDNYAGVTFSDIPLNDGRRIFMGWMNNWQYANLIPTNIWRGATTLPRSLELLTENSEYFLKTTLVKEFENLVISSQSIESKVVNGELKFISDAKFPIEIDLNFTIENEIPEKFGVFLINSKNEKVVFGYDKMKKSFFIDNTKNGWDNPKKEFAIVSYAPYNLIGDKLKMKLVIDKSSVELFVENGKIAMTNQFFPSEEFRNIQLFSENGTIQLTNGFIKNLKSIYK